MEYSLPYDTIIGDELARDICGLCCGGAMYARAETPVFPDGELITKLGCGGHEINDKDVLVTLTEDRFRRNPSGYVLKTIFLLDSVLEQNPSSLDLLMPYMFFARQDKNFTPDESESLRVVAGLLDQYLDNMYTLHSHLCGKPEGSHRLSNYFDRAIVHDLDASPLLGGYMKDNGIVDRPVVVGPDRGATRMAMGVASVFEGSDWMCFDKTRDRLTRETTMVENPVEAAKVRGRDVLVVDDLTESGDPIVKAAGILRKYEPSRIVVGLGHLLGEKPVGRIIDSGVEHIVTTESLRTGDAPDIYRHVTRIPIAEFVARNMEDSADDSL
jgi:ribose-phosphate pyrophosphokinase